MKGWKNSEEQIPKTLQKIFKVHEFNQFHELNAETEKHEPHFNINSMNDLELKYNFSFIKTSTQNNRLITPKRELVCLFFFS